MPSLLQHQSTSAMKMLLVGESGTAKTGALADLIDAGYSSASSTLTTGLMSFPSS